MGIGRILLSPQHFFHTPNLLQLPLNHPPCCPPTHMHLHTSPQGCFVHHWNVCVELTQSTPCAPCQNTKSLHMHTGPRGPLLFGWCTHYVPTTSHQPPASFCTAPAPPHTLRASLHCHIWTCPSIHVSLCLEEFSPQTSPSGTNYPMVGVLSMCPPHHFSQIPTSGHPCGPTWTRFFCLPGPSWLVHHLVHPSAPLPAPPCTSAPLCAPPCTSTHLSAPPCTPAQLLCFTFQR